MTSVVHCMRDEYDVYIGRPSKWGNPFQIGVHGTREEVVDMYRVYIQGRVDLNPKELQGLRLGCWCVPELCHGHVLAELADAD